MLSVTPGRSLVCLGVTFERSCFFLFLFLFLKNYWVHKTRQKKTSKKLPWLCGNKPFSCCVVGSVWQACQGSYQPNLLFLWHRMGVASLAPSLGVPEQCYLGTLQDSQMPAQLPPGSVGNYAYTRTGWSFSIHSVTRHALSCRYARNQNMN